jgi:hypothetical protein
VEVSLLDLAVDEWDPRALEGMEGVAISVPMHTAMRLAVSLAREIRRVRPDLPIAFYGLYAGVGREQTLGMVADALFVGEYEPGLVAWATTGGAAVPEHRPISVYVGGSAFRVPDRTGLPEHDRYARLEWEGEARLAGAVEASHGCRHRCRHCPIPVVYDGRMRVVGHEAVLGDIDRLVSEGVRHVTFADPDFLNAPRYSLDLVRAAHAAHPDLTFDVTVKVEHVLEHDGVWEELAGLGVLFVVSAFESTDDRTLEILDKGHTVGDMIRALAVLRSAGIHPRPTWLPFFPWTTPADMVELARFLDAYELWAATDPVQLAIKLLVPEGSLMVGHPALVPHLISYQPETLTWAWRFAHDSTRRLHEDLESIAADASDCGAEGAETLATMRDLIGSMAGVELPAISVARTAPRLTESWFCCAEPTSNQGAAVGLTLGRVPVTSNRAV